VEKHRPDSVHLKTGVGGKLVRLKTHRNWELKQTVVLASALGEERKIARNNSGHFNIKKMVTFAAFHTCCSL